MSHPTRTRGWVIPAGLRAPLDVAVFRDDVHVIVFMVGHPQFEAVEAMISHPRSGRALVRAIVTLHDQTQVDHTNDAGIRDRAAISGRRIVMTEISTQVSYEPGRVRARVSFEAFTGDKIDLNFFGIGLPGAELGGLSDPGRHAVGSSLPIMWRGKSTMGSDGSSVQVNGRVFDAPAVQRIGAQGSLRRAFLTEDHMMAVIRAGNRRVVGEWKSHGAENYQAIECLVFPCENGESNFTVEFTDDVFHCHIGAAKVILTGKAWTEQDADLVRLCLAPTAPAWAAARPVIVTVARAIGGYDVATRVG